jgi:hypothetical protein
MSDTLCEKVFTYNQTLKCVFSQITSFTILKSPPLPLSSTLRSAALHELPHALYYASGLPERQATGISPIGWWIVVQSMDRYVVLLVHIPIRGKGPWGTSFSELSISRMISWSCQRSSHTSYHTGAARFFLCSHIHLLGVLLRITVRHVIHHLKSSHLHHPIRFLRPHHAV